MLQCRSVAVVRRLHSEAHVFRHQRLRLIHSLHDHVLGTSSTVTFVHGSFVHFGRSWYSRQPSAKVT
jgi:G:T-mismatch repair DNA endonuclease (very short patch repair protein)